MSAARTCSRGHASRKSRTSLPFGQEKGRKLRIGRAGRALQSRDQELAGVWLHDTQSVHGGLQRARAIRQQAVSGDGIA